MAKWACDKPKIRAEEEKKCKERGKRVCKNLLPYLQKSNCGNVLQ